VFCGYESLAEHELSEGHVGDPEIFAAPMIHGALPAGRAASAFPGWSTACAGSSSYAELSSSSANRAGNAQHR